MENPEINFLIAGTGDFVRKMTPTWEQYRTQGVKLLAMDIIDDPIGKPYLPKGTPFYNISYPNQLRELLQSEPFHLCLLSNYPSIHLATALRFDFFTERFIFPKPVDSNLQLLKTMKDEKDRNFQSIVSKMLVHDHYRNKPLVTRLKSLLPFLHGKFGFVQEVRIYITERRTPGREWRRKGALDDGLILDLAPHALSVLLELLPKKFSWKNEDGDLYERVNVTLDKVIGCYRARDNNCILKDGAESFAVIDLRGEEIINFHPKGELQPLSLDPHYFRVLIVVGKGTSIDNPSNENDLKAIQMAFDGNIILGNFDTNAIGGVAAESLLNHLAEDVNPGHNHKGINLPFQRLAEKEFDFTALNKNATGAIKDFQTFDEASEVLDILTKILQHESARNIIHYYVPGIPSSDLINRLKGLDPRWQHPGPPTQLQFGPKQDVYSID